MKNQQTKKSKKAVKTVGVVALVIALCGTTTFAAVAMLKWNGGATITQGNDFIQKATLKLVQLQQQLDEAIAGGGNNETIVELERTIVLLNEEVQKANTAAVSQQNQLDWAMAQLQAAGILLD